MHFSEWGFASKMHFYEWGFALNLAFFKWGFASKTRFTYMSKETGQQKTESRNTCHCIVNCFVIFLDEKNADWNNKIIQIS